MKPLSPWIAALLAVPIGGAAGAIAGGMLCGFILSLEGKGQSHNDMISVVAAQIGGAFIGALIVAPAIWILQLKRTKHMRPKVPRLDEPTA